MRHDLARRSDELVTDSFYNAFADNIHEESNYADADTVTKRDLRSVPDFTTCRETERSPFEEPTGYGANTKQTRARIIQRL